MLSSLALLLPRAVRGFPTPSRLRSRPGHHQRKKLDPTLPIDLSSLNPQQRLAVQTTEGPLLVLSGAGTGKTRVITYRIAHLVDQGVSPASILAVTFTRKAALEMRERVGKLVGRAAAREMVVSTFHSFCVRVLREDIERLGYKANFTIADANDQLSIMRSALREIVLPGQTFDPALVLFKVGRAKNDALSPKQLENRAGDDLDLVAAGAYKRYQDMLEAQNTLDFDDMLLLAVKLFSRHKDVLAKYQRRFAYVMVDEYQDTNHTQYQLLRAISQGRRNLCVVGDDDQSIYGWRGAHVGNILNFERDFPGAKVVRLEQNYRSTTVILEAANAVVANNARRKEKRLWTNNGAGELIDCIEAADDREEADEVVRRIAGIAARAKGSYDGCAILYRTNAQSRTFEEKLRLRRIPYTVVGGMKYYDRKEIRDVMAYFRAITNPDDEVALRRIINVPARGISKDTVRAVSDFSIAHKISMAEALLRADEMEDINPRARQACGAFVGLLSRHRDAFGPGALAEPARRLLEEVEYEDELSRQFSDAGESMGRIENVREIVSALAEYEKSPERNTLVDYLDDVATRDEERDDPDTPNHAKLMSLHSAKGLEFPYVFLVGMEEGLLPHKKSELDGQDTVDEERRLCYVGITRAKKHLTLTHVAERVKYGRPTQPVPSRFIEEIPAQLLLRRTNSSHEPVTMDRRAEYLAAIRGILDSDRGAPISAPDPGRGRPPATSARKLADPGAGRRAKRPARKPEASRPAAKPKPRRTPSTKGLQQAKPKRPKA